MRADLFYETHNSGVPLYLVSATQWEFMAETLTSAERNCFAIRQFKGKTGDYSIVLNGDGLIDKAYVGTGTGTQAQALAQAALLLPPGCYELQESLTLNAAIAWALAQYRFVNYKKFELLPRILVVAEAELNDILAITESTFLVRDLINKPASDMGPAHMAHVVEQLAHKYNGTFTQWVGNELLTHNFPAIHAVGRASAAAPRLLSLIWGDESHPKVSLVGKGVCFDTGGLDIKPSSGMRLMKKDMGGAAHVIGLAQWIMMKKLPIRLHMLIPAVENSIGPDAFRPGDVLTMRNGLTVEVDNTDAEGRLVLADALVKATEENPELIIDFATLTGAARVAVGTEMAALFTNDDEFATAIAESATQTADPVWRMPLFAAYEELLNSTVADIVNASTSPFGGAITAALFLQRFIDKKTAWAHFDIMAWNVGNKPGRPEGGEAMGLRAVADYLRRTYGALK